MKEAYLSYILFSSVIVFVLVKILLAFFMSILGFLETLVAAYYWLITALFYNSTPVCVKASENLKLCV